jgi:glutathione S-transferase
VKQPVIGEQFKRVGNIVSARETSPVTRLTTGQASNIASAMDAKLYTSPRSPFGRKVKIALVEMGLEEAVETCFVSIRPAAPPLKILPVNPLGTLPVLVLASGEQILDSLAIIDFFSHEMPGKGLIPSEPMGRRETLRRHAFANGGLDKAVRALEERFRKENEDTRASEKAATASIMRMLTLIDGEAGQWANDRFDVGDIAFVCLLGYLEFRYDWLGWKDLCPHLERWFAHVSSRHSVKQTVPSD